ncbi:phage major capsid protein [Succinimonas amylolytica]|uniref:phage major capsid protein n=1 Tax=Succinimonas amylolytica TaxID=83769 RepID=UPI0023A7C642
MTTVNELREKRASAWNAAKAFLESRRTDKGTLTAEDDAAYTRMEQDITDLSKEIARLERRDALDAELSRPVSQPLTSKPASASPHDSGAKRGRASDEYREGMLRALRSNFKQVSNVLQEGVDADGGYLVPEEYDSRLIDVLTEENIMRSLGNVITTSGEHKINIAATKPAAAWIEEGGALSFGDATFSQILLDAHKLHVAIKVTEELLYDAAFNLEGYIIDQFGKALANAEEDAFLNGTGRGQPLGLFAETGGGTPALSAASINADHIMQLIYALKRPYRKSARFIMHDKVIAAIRQLKDNNGVYLWQPALTSGEPDKLLGYDVYTSPFCPEGKIAFGDFSYYNIGDRGTRSFSELRELFAGNGMIGYVAKERVDGKLILPEAVQILTITGGKPLKP